MKDPLVSVIIPNYCHAKYLDQRIQTVLGQTFQNFEVIILDDASPDDGASKNIIEKYRDNQHVSHILYSEVNSGSTFIQWNKGFELAKGEFIWIAESDDYCELNFLETLVPFLVNYSETSVAQTSSWYVDCNGARLHTNGSSEEVICNYPGKDFIKKYLIQSNFYIPNASAVVFRNQTARKISKEYMKYKAAGDRFFWILMLEEGNICWCKQSLNYFRQHHIKVTQRKELDGTQARENYRINRYLQARNYIKGITAIESFRYYWNYLSTFKFDSEDTRQELINLYFPWWQRNKVYRFYINLYYLLFGSAYRLKCICTKMFKK